MSGDAVAAAAVGAAVAMLVMGVVMTVVVAHVYQGMHAARLDDRERDRARCRAYHRLSPAERRIWRRQEAAEPGVAGPAGHDVVVWPVERPAPGARRGVCRCA